VALPARLGEQPGTVEALAKALRFATGQIGIGGGIKYCVDVIVHAPSVPLGGSADAVQQFITGS
jgi:hypothetical protein